MAGHSKWHNIQHRKGAQDAKRGKLFTKLIREIVVAAKMGDPDPTNNPRLRTAVDKALSGNMTKDTIQRAIKRGAGGDGEADMMEIRYEGYGPNGVAIIVDCLTDNKNRTVAEVRHAFNKYGGNLGTAGSVAYIFEKKGIIIFSSPQDEDTLIEAAIEAGAVDAITHDDQSMEIMTEADDLVTVKETLIAAELLPDHAEVTLVASNQIHVNFDQAQTLLKLSDVLDDLDDVQNVYTNADISEEVLEQLQSLS